MTNQIPPEVAIPFEQIGAAFAESYGLVVGRLTFRILDLAQQSQALQARLAGIETKAFDTEQQNANLIKAQIALEDETFNLKSEVTTLTNRTQELEAELAEYRANEKAAPD